MKIKRFFCVLLIVIAALQIAVPSSAATPYANYFITTQGKMTLPTPAAYEVMGTINLASTSIGSLNKAKDMFMKSYDVENEDGSTSVYTRLYIADTENNRIVVLTNEPLSAGEVADPALDAGYNFRVDFVIQGDASDKTDPSNLKSPEGLFVDDDGTIIVADTRNFRLVEFTERGNFRYSYKVPESELLGEDFNFQPLKVIKDDRGYIYVTSIGDYRGILLLNSYGEFSSYFGANAVSLSVWESIVKMIWSREDTMGTIVKLPYTFQNIYASEDGYVYATTAGTTSGQLRKISSAGTDVLYAGYDFNDPGTRKNVSFFDVTVDKNNNMFVLDNMMGRIYEYDEWGQNLFAFGTKGSGYGQFSDPQSIVVDNAGIVYVLDSQTNLITLFKPTAFADSVHTANNLYSEGYYDESFPIWQEVLNQNSYYVLALTSMGKIYFREEQYEDSMDMFYKAEDAKDYSTSFVELRYIFIKDYFSIIMTAIIALAIVLFILGEVRRRYRKKHGVKEKKRNFLTPVTEFLKEMVYVPRHPVDGFEGIRYENKSNYRSAILIMLIYFATNMLSILATSFIYRGGKPLSMTNWSLQTGLVFLPWIVIVIVNYGVTTIMYGEGRFRDIFIGGAYCHVPFILTQLPMAILTNVLSQQEQSLFSLAQSLIYIWVFFLVYMCIKGVHGYHAGKAIVVLLITVVGVAAVTGLFMIFYGLASQMFGFFIQFGKELSYLV